MKKKLAAVLAAAIAISVIVVVTGTTPAQAQPRVPTPNAVRVDPTLAAQSTAAVYLPNYHWNASSIGVGECTDNTCRAWVRLPAGQRTDSYFGWSHAYGVRYDALACFDFWDTPADNSQLGWTFAGRVTVSKAYPAVPLDERYHWRYAIHTTISCP